MEQTNRIAFALLRYALCKEEIPFAVRELLTQERLENVYQLLKMHDLAHLGYDGLLSIKNGELAKTDIYEKFKKQQQFAVYRYEQKQYEYEQICCTFEEAQIPYLPLKGAVIKDFYPEAWFRTSCDIDILVKEEYLAKAINLLCEKLGYKKANRGTHDVSLYSPSNIHVELHFNLLEDSMAKNASKILNSVWDRVESNEKCRKNLKDDFFYYYHIAHMAKHIEFGGCGIKPFLDLWILNENIEFNQEKCDALLIEGDLKDFERIAKTLAYIWFGDLEHTPITKRLEIYILTGGVYGSTENKVAAQAIKKGGGLKYIFSRIWYPYSLLKKRYPRVEKCKWLIPYYQACRWFTFLFKQKKKNVIIEVRASRKLSNEKAENIQSLLHDLGL